MKKKKKKEKESRQNFKHWKYPKKKETDVPKNFNVWHGWNCFNMVTTPAINGPPSIPSLPFLRTNATKFVSYANFGKHVTTNKNNNVAIFSNGSKKKKKKKYKQNSR